MAAAAFTATLIFKGDNGRVIHVRTTISDVAAAFWIFPDGNSFITLPGDSNYSLTDVITVVGGTDTTNSDLYVNGLNSGIQIDHKSNLNTANFRQFIQSPIKFKAGALLRLTQRA
jgi:hypothetical protein